MGLALRLDADMVSQPPAYHSEQPATYFPPPTQAVRPKSVPFG
jgi:hypothetical protein